METASLLPLLSPPDIVDFTVVVVAVVAPNFASLSSMGALCGAPLRALFRGVSADDGGWCTAMPLPSLAAAAVGNDAGEVVAILSCGSCCCCCFCSVGLVRGLDPIGVTTIESIGSSRRRRTPGGGPAAAATVLFRGDGTSFGGGRQTTFCVAVNCIVNKPALLSLSDLRKSLNEGSLMLAPKFSFPATAAAGGLSGATPLPPPVPARVRLGDLDGDHVYEPNSLLFLLLAVVPSLLSSPSADCV